jgi:hypothetical protein
MVLISCDSQCSLARKCGKHILNRPSPKMRDQVIKKHKPKMKKKCPGYEELR